MEVKRRDGTHTSKFFLIESVPKNNFQLILDVWKRKIWNFNQLIIHMLQLASMYAYHPNPIGYVLFEMD